MNRAVPVPPFAHALRRRFREDGATAAARHLGTRLRAQAYERNRHIVVEKDLHEIAVPLRRGEVRIEDADRRHLPALCALNRERGDLTGDVRFGGDLDDGYGGFVAYKGEELVGCYWWATAGMPPHRELRAVALGIRLGPDDVYGTDFYVSARHRAGGTAADFLWQIETALRERGFARLWGTVEVGNASARWTYAARGYHERWAVAGTRVLRRWSYRIVSLDEEGAAPE